MDDTQLFSAIRRFLEDCRVLQESLQQEAKSTESPLDKEDVIERSLAAIREASVLLMTLTRLKLSISNAFEAKAMSAIQNSRAQSVELSDAIQSIRTILSALVERNRTLRDISNLDGDRRRYHTVNDHR